MKLLILSDSHGNTHCMNQVFEKIGDAFKVVVHLGDCVDDLNFLKQQYQSYHYHYVKGNCDYGSPEGSEAIIHVSDKKIFMTHGHAYHVKYNYDRLVYAALEKEVDVCLFGHSHLPTIFYEQGILFMNPGSISLPRGIAYPSYGVLDISDQNGVLQPSIVAVERNGYKILGAPYVTT